MIVGDRFVTIELGEKAFAFTLEEAADLIAVAKEVEFERYFARKNGKPIDAYVYKQKGYLAVSPDLPGRYGTGDSPEDAIRNL